MVPIQLDNAECRYGQEPADSSTPEQIYERRWAGTLLERVLANLQEEYATQGKGELFEALKPCLLGEGDTQPYASIAPKLGISEGALKVAAHRFRKRYRELLREDIAHTVAVPVVK